MGLNMEYDLGGIIYPALQAAFVFAIAPLVIGIMRKVKATFQSRTGAPIYQPYIDLAKLFLKGMVVSETSSWVFLAAPIATFASVAIAVGILPIMFAGSVLPSTLIVFVYLFAIGRFMTALSALDTGSAFGGIGASREMLFAALIEPVLFGAIIFFATFGGSVPLVALASSPNGYLSAIVAPELWLAAIAIFIAILAETGRLPFDNPATHLELTMVHEAMILDNSGPLLALIEWANAAKIVAFFGFFATLLLPTHLLISTGNPIFLAAAFCATIAALALITAAIESVTPKLRLFKISKLLIFSLVLSLLAFLIRVSDGVQSGSLPVFLSFLMLVTAIYFIFSATFKRRLEIFILQSAALALILALVIMDGDASADAMWRLGSTIVFKLIVVPLLLLKAFDGLRSESKDTLNTDPVFMGSPVGISGSFVLCGVLMMLSHAIAPILGIHNQMLPAAFSIILIGCLIIATKSHVMLQLMGFLILENGLVLLPTALAVQVPIIGEIIALFDTLTLVAVALVLMFKISAMAESPYTANLEQLREER